MRDAAASFAATADAAQRAAGLIAARHRGDLQGADTLLADLDDRTRAAGCLFLAELAIALLARADGRDIGAVAAELSLQLADVAPTIGD